MLLCVDPCGFGDSEEVGEWSTRPSRTVQFPAAGPAAWHTLEPSKVTSASLLYLSTIETIRAGVANVMLRWCSVSTRVGIRSASSTANSHAITIREALPEEHLTRKQKPKQKDGLATTRPSGTISKSLDEVARATRSRHLLRAILRECTYLPDAFARQWTAKYAISRFRSYDYKAWKHRKDESFKERLIRKEREARQSLALLRRANEGERDCLLKVLLMAYGRIGRRRHELMAPLLSPNSLQNYASVTEDALSGEDPAGDVRGGKESRTLDLTPQLQALLTSQMKTAPPSLTRRNPRRIDPIIPELNNWLRPMPQKRIKNMKQKHYADLLDRVLPPLPFEDWTRLHSLASGWHPLEAPRPRRAFPEDLKNSAAAGSALDMVVRYGKLPSKVFPKQDTHILTPRFMRRLYAVVFSQCPLMELEDGTSDQWKITWGSRALAENASTCSE